MLARSDDERYRSTLVPRWINYPYATAILEQMQALFDHPRIHRPPMLSVVGNANNGKTLLARRFEKRHPSNHDVLQARTTVPVLLASAPINPDVGPLYNELLDAFNASYNLSDDVTKKRRQLESLLASSQTRVIMIDEIHNILVGHTRKQQAMLVALKQLSNDTKIPLAVLGTHAAYRAVQSMEETGTRFEGVELPDWACDEQFRAMLQQYETTLPLKAESNLQEEELARLIHARCEGRLGEMAKLLSSACRQVIGTADERITLDVVRYDPGFTPLSVRRQRPPRPQVRPGKVEVRPDVPEGPKPKKKQKKEPVKEKTESKQSKARKRAILEATLQTPPRGSRDDWDPAAS